MSKPKNPPSTNIWLGNLPADINKEWLMEVFSRYGDIASARVFPPKGGGQFASAMMRAASQEVATFIVDELDGTQVDGLGDAAIATNYGKDGQSSGPQQKQWSGGGALGPPTGGGALGPPSGGGGALGPHTGGGMLGPGKGCGGKIGGGGSHGKGKGKGDGWSDGWSDYPPKGGDFGKGKGKGKDWQKGGKDWPKGGKPDSMKGGKPDSMRGGKPDSMRGGKPDAGVAGRLAAAVSSRGASASSYKPAGPAALPARQPTKPRNPPATNIWIGNLPPDLDKESFIELFSGYGDIQSARVFPPKPGSSHSSAMARLATLDQARHIVETLDGGTVPGLVEPLSLNYASPDKEAQRADRSGGDSSFRGGGSASRGSDWEESGYGKAGGDAGYLRPRPETGARGSHPYGGKGAGKSGGRDGADAANRPIGAIGAIGAVGAGGSSKASSAPRAGGADGRAEEGGWNRPAITTDRLLSAVQDAGVIGRLAPDEGKLYVKNLPSDMDDFGLYRLFCPFGALACGGVKAALHPDGTCKGYGFVDFLDADAAEQAKLSLNGFEPPGGKELVVEQANDAGMDEDNPFAEAEQAAEEAYGEDYPAESEGGWV